MYAIIYTPLKQKIFILLFKKKHGIYDRTDDTPCADVVFLWYHHTLPFANIPPTIRVTRKDASPATVSVATTVSQWNALDFCG